MANKTFNTRVKNKRDTAANWEAVATTFQPLDGELIIVDTAAGKTRFKVGRYDTAKGRLLYYNEIPFTDEYLYNDLNESQGKIYDKLKGIDDKSIIEMTIEPFTGNDTQVWSYRIGLWQFPKTGFYKINLPKTGAQGKLIQMFARITQDDGTTPEDDWATTNLKRMSFNGGDAAVDSIYALAEYADNSAVTAYRVQFFNFFGFPGTVEVNTYNKTTQKWTHLSVARSDADTANKVGNALTLTKGDTTTTFNGSTAQTVSIPTKTSELTNDSDFTTQTDLDNLTNTVVSYSAQENITDEQKAQARTNIGAISSSEVSSNYLSLDDTQELTEIQQDVLKNKLGYIDRLKVLSSWVEATEQCKKEGGCVLVIQDGAHNDGDIIPVMSRYAYPLLLIPARISSTDQSFHVIDAYGDNYACSFRYSSYKFNVTKLDMNQQTMNADPTENMQIATKQYVDNAAVQADWNQNDTTAKDYIKNRICYTEESITELGNTYEIWKELIGSTTEIVDIPLSIKYDGIIYKYIKPQYIDQHYHYVLDSSGNSRIIVPYTGVGSTGTITAYPEKEWSFVQVNDPIIHQIPSEYINMDDIVNDGIIPFIHGSFAPEIISNFVAYSIEQSLSDDQKKQARDNIGAMPSVIAGPNTLGGVKPELGILIDEADKLSVHVDSETGRLFIDGKLAKSIPIVDSFYNSTSRNDVFHYATSVACVATSMSVSGASFESPDLTAPVLFLFGTGDRGKYPIFGIDSSGATFDGVINTSNNNPSYQIDKTSAITIDTILSNTSTNPVQNKVVKAAIDDLQASIDSKSMDKITNGDVTLACGGTDGTEYLHLSSTTDAGCESDFYGNSIYQYLYETDGGSAPALYYYSKSQEKVLGGLSVEQNYTNGKRGIEALSLFTIDGKLNVTSKYDLTLQTTNAGNIIVTSNNKSTNKFDVQMPSTVLAPTEDMNPATKKYVDDQMTTINNQLGGLTGAMHFIGKAAVDITDGSTTDPQIANYTTKEKGDVILGKDDHKEFVWNGAIWEELGDEGSYALKTTTINGKALSDNITLTASDVGAASASTIETMQAAIDSKPSAADAVYTATAASTDGVAYTATVSGIDSLTVGASFIMIPNKASTSKAPTLNVNGLGAKPIRRRLSSLTTSLQQGYSTNWIALNKPFTVVYDGTAWVIEGLTKTDGADVYGAVAQATADAKGNNIADTYATIAMLQSLLPKVTTITLTSNWVGDASPYYQDIALSCVTETSIVDLQPTPEQLSSWQDDGIAFTTLSGNGTVRVYVAGGKPSSAISVQVRVQEVTVI